MGLKSFLYRRFAGLITCEFQLQENAKIALASKYEIASFQDVFCQPFYWQVFNLIDKAPRLIIDCGAHCGHFSILVDTCFRSKFNCSDTEYILVEPNPLLLPIIRKNIDAANLKHRTQIIAGLLGNSNAHGANGTLWVDPNNYLSASLHPAKTSKAYQIPYVNLLEIIGERQIDLMKIDIEGAEYEFIRDNAYLLNQVNLIFLELHHASAHQQDELLRNLKSAGLNLIGEPLKSHGNQLLIFQGQKILSPTRY